MSDRDPFRRLGAPDPDLTPDPTFWGANGAAPHRQRRRRPPGLAERVTAAIPSRDARTAIAAVVAVLIVATVLVSFRATTPAAPVAPSRPPTTGRAHRPATGSPRRVVVHVAGAVTRPGVVTLPGGDRVIDAIDTAGGARPDANLDGVNLAARLRDGQQILVPATTTAASTTPTVLPAPPTSVGAPP